jgi:hypothetical protein
MIALFDPHPSLSGQEKVPKPNSGPIVLAIPNKCPANVVGIFVVGRDLRGRADVVGIFFQDFFNFTCGITSLLLISTIFLFH